MLCLCLGCFILYFLQFKNGYFSHFYLFHFNLDNFLLGAIRLRSVSVEPLMWAFFRSSSTGQRSEEEIPDVFIPASLFCWNSFFLCWWPQNFWKIKTREIIYGIIYGHFCSRLMKMWYARRHIHSNIEQRMIRLL